MIAFDAEKGNFIERVDCPEFRIEFEAVYNPDGIIDPDVLGAQVPVAIHDMMAANARREQLRLRQKEPALGVVDFRTTPSGSPSRESNRPLRLSLRLRTQSATCCSGVIRTGPACR